MAALVVRHRARAEIRAVAKRYRAESPAAAEAFLRKVEHALALIAESPERFHLLRRRLRRVLLLPQFPYGIYYRILPRVITVVGVIHLRRHPRQWLMRESPRRRSPAGPPRAHAPENL